MTISQEEREKRDNFAGVVIQLSVDMLSREGIELEGIEYDAEQFRIMLGDSFWNLENLYREYEFCGDNEAKQSIIFKQIDLIKATLEPEDYSDFESVRERLFPSIRDRLLAVASFFDEPVSLADGDDAVPKILHQQLAEHYVTMLAIDRETTMSYASQDMLDGWGKSFEEAFEVCMINLASISTEPFECVADGVYLSSWHDSYDTSRLLLTEKIRSECEVRGDYLAFMPNRDHLFITGSDDIAGIKMVLEYCDEISQWPRAMLMVPLILDGRGWSVFDPPRSHRCYFDIRRQVIGTEYEVYGSTQEALQNALTDDVYVATFNVYKKENSDDLHSACVWSVRSLLPRCEWVTFVEVAEDSDDGQIVGMARWEDVATVLGASFVPAFSYPPRYLVEALLDRKILDSVKLHPGFVDDEIMSFAPDNDEKRRPFLEVITEARERYISKYRKLIETSSKLPSSAPEVIFATPEAEEHLIGGITRADFIEKREDGIHVTYQTAPNVSIEPTEYWLNDGQKLMLKPFAWNDVEIHCDRFDFRAPAFSSWCTRWLDPNEHFSQDEYGLSGVVHSVTKPQLQEDIAYFSVDFGSAPVEAFESLMDALYNSGVKLVVVRSSWNKAP